MFHIREEIADAMALDEHHFGTEGILRRYRSRQLVAKSAATLAVLDMIELTAATEAKILFTGETGVGKEIFALLAHENSTRREGEFVAVNCGAIPEQLMESEFFGYEKGAFTGAQQKKTGLIENASGGSLYLDEIGELPLAMQVKLLSALNTHEYRRVGGTKILHSNMRIITATNADLEALVASGKFRADLFYRLNIVRIHIPPLRERTEDIPDLIRVNIERYNKQHNKNKQLSDEATASFLAYDWPGNIRELENVIERLVVTTRQDIITSAHLPCQMLKKSKSGNESLRTLREVRQEAERRCIELALRKCVSVRQAALAIGITHTTMIRKMREYAIESKTQ